MAAPRFSKELRLKRKPVDAIALRKTRKAADAWLMSARWWKNSQTKIPKPDRARP
jgi:hypothetical protein